MKLPVCLWCGSNNTRGCVKKQSLVYFILKKLMYKQIIKSILLRNE